MNEIDLFPYTASSEIPANRVLVLAPHPDDEVFGCGGAIANHIARGSQVDVIILTDGSKGGDPTTRYAESTAAAACLGYGKPEFWGLCDRELTCTITLTDRVCELITSRQIDLLYAPSPWEIHPDHRACAQLALQTIERLGAKCRIAFYEVGAPLRPNLLLDITPHIAIKENAIACFSSQLTNQKYADQIAGLNCYRTYSLPRTVISAEAYLLISYGQLADFMSCQRKGLVTWGIDNIGAKSNNVSLVSILIRSTGRQYLYEALNSIALQTWPNIEIVVIAATADHPELPSHWGGYAVKFVRTKINLKRSKAANIGLSEARGDYLIFLDDDDWFMPDHISRLVKALHSYPFAFAAYTGVALADAFGKPLGQTLDLPFDHVQQRAGNLTPIHAVLFDSTLLQQGIVFNETLDIFEDWDFWLQIGQVTNFVHIPGVSAVYRVHESSGVHKIPMAEHETAQQIQASWSGREPVSQLDLMTRVWSYNDMEHKFNNASKSLYDTQSQLTDTQLQLTDTQLQLTDVYSQLSYAHSQVNDVQSELLAVKDEFTKLLNSNSWKITKPLRIVFQFLRILFNSFSRLKFVRFYSLWKRSGTIATYNKVLQHIVSHPLNNHHYMNWLSMQASHQPTMLKTLREQEQSWLKLPLISIIMPVYNPPLELLHAAINSISEQIYSNWELCIADDASTNPEVWATLQIFAQNDKRIKIIRRKENGHISKASNSALSLASGDFIALMDNDDLLSPDALHWVADSIISHPSVNIIYSDEDKLDASGNHFGPYFKSDWNYTLFLGHNLISHLGVYRTSLIKEIGGFSVGMEGSQDYDLALRCIERSDKHQIVHIPRVLYHWRAIEGSTALSNDAKPYAVVAAKRAIEEHRSRIGQPCNVEILPTNNYRIHRNIQEPRLKKTIIFWSHSSNPSSQASLNPKLQGFISNFDQVMECSCNLDDLNNAIYRADGDLIIVCKDSIEPISSDALDKIIQLALEEETGISSGTIRNSDGLIISGGLILSKEYFASAFLNGSTKGDDGFMGRGLLTQELSAVPLNCIAFRKKVFNDAYGLNPKLGNIHLSMVDLCLRLNKLGYRIIWEPCSEWIDPLFPNSNYELPTLEHPGSKEVIENNPEVFSSDPAYHRALDPRTNFAFKQ